MEIIAQSRDNINKVQIYKMTKSPEVETFKSVQDDTIIAVADWIQYRDVKSDGEESTILAIMSDEGKVYACESKTFTNSFFEILDIMEDVPFSIKKISGTTKAGRPYINCVLEG